MVAVQLHLIDLPCKYLQTVWLLLRFCSNSKAVCVWWMAKLTARKRQTFHSKNLHLHPVFAGERQEMRRGSNYIFAHSQGSHFAYYVTKLLRSNYNVNVKAPWWLNFPKKGWWRFGVNPTFANGCHTVASFSPKILAHSFHHVQLISEPKVSEKQSTSFVTWRRLSSWVILQCQVPTHRQTSAHWRRGRVPNPSFRGAKVSLVGAGSCRCCHQGSWFMVRWLAWFGTLLESNLFVWKKAPFASQRNGMTISQEIRFLELRQRASEGNIPNMCKSFLFERKDI